ncbi:AbrB/MazE/SpoVT family DNA-binding domain-containing protein [Paenibacillus dendritiformis]|uniref:AbrB/MazE/SpoVT family DNA-binding domain-containing protein n=1 Tax=Paenibacillus dendritiformis TaxID=130049 RepID=UPI000DAAA8C7|nr:AbrB/MazE/SpoVT family DNA-binding domain-containing protein [Paenibacillus dendritiformis]PZM61740.1 hypothetical protein DOE73_31015 [Paenibacillus dendritiformis]
MKEFNKKISKSGSITLPAALRRDYGLTDGERFKIVVDGEDGSILLQRTEGSCLFCGSGNELIVFNGRFVCATCIEHMDGQTLDGVLQGLGLDAATIKSVKKKLKGDYLKDKRVLESVGITGECEEELDAIRQIKNTELIDRFFSGLTAEQLERIRKSVFVEDQVGVGLEYEK